MSRNKPEPMQRRSLRGPACALALAAALVPAAAPAQVEIDLHRAPPDTAALMPETLPALLARALPNDPALAVARAQWRVARERWVQARSRLGPSVVATATRGGTRGAELGNPLQRRTERAEAGLRWNLYNAGDDSAELRGAAQDLEAAAQDLRRAREDVTERIANAYAELLRLQGLVPQARERLHAVQRLVYRVQQQAMAGKASDADAQQAQVSRLDAGINLEQLLQDREAARARLSALIGQEVGLPRPVALAPVPEVGAEPQSGLLGAVRARAQAARERVRPVATALAPRVDLELRQRLSDRTTPALTTEERESWLLTARWELPVGGESLSRRTETRYRAEAADAEAERVLRGAQSELVALGPRIASAERALVQLDEQLASYEMLLRAAELQWEAGRRTLTQVMQLHDSRWAARQRRADQANQLLTAQLRRHALQGTLLQALEQPVEDEDGAQRP